MSKTKTDGFRVSLDQHLLETLLHRWPRCSRWLGDVETYFYRERLASNNIDRPIFIAGLARSGSTILLELFAEHGEAATHRYHDFPFIFTPCWSEEIQRHASRQGDSPVERAHGDGLMVTSASPEAMEEPLWMAFFPWIHDNARRQVLDEEFENAPFEEFFRDHIRKILSIRGGRRYLSKGNYNITRLGYLHRLFPDARFVIPIRHPLQHVASLIKQHRLFSESQRAHPRAIAHLSRKGHFEFGLNRRAINVGDDGVTRSILRLWEQGEDVRGWARYWANLYGWLHEELQRNSKLGAAAHIVHFEDLCGDANNQLERLFEHVDLRDDGLAAALAQRVQAPTYYRPDFTAEEEAVIYAETRQVAELFGYGEIVGAETTPTSALATCRA